jgi:hypothetical protein
MKKSTSLNKSKLSSYTAFAGAIVAGSAANAQVTYTDVNPDVVADSLNPFVIDFNNDATPDLIFGVQHISGSFSSQGQNFTYEGAFAYGFLPAGFPTATTVTNPDNTIDTLTAVLDCGVAVAQSPLFSGSNTAVLGYAALIQPINYPFSAGPWLGQTDKYLGFKFTVGSGTHYGWARLDVAANAETITIKQYAFNATPDGAINTCEGGTNGIENVSVEDKVTIKTTLNDATINVTPDLIGGTINLVSMTGQVVKTILISDVNTTITFEGVESGIYSVSANFNGGSVNKRVYVK